ncbi:Nn.00g059230.m01.CDS01 [Neocucurbitaria sp. VM-36]
MPQYCYSPLPETPGTIRLLRLLPDDNDEADIRGELFDYRLQESSKAYHSYDASSYVWGSPNKSQFIIITGAYLDVTPNLHAALLQLRDPLSPRILWIDAICINQTDELEKVRQIQSMATIYGVARDVIVWLGTTANNSDEALEAIRTAGSSKETLSPNHYSPVDDPSLSEPSDEEAV